VKEARMPVIRALESCKARDTAGLLLAGERLVGLGEGLTPSGDDFLGGLLFTQRYLDPVYRRPSLDWGAVDAWLAESRARTSAISYAILSDLARGHGPEPLHDMVCSITEGASSDQIALHAARLTQIGRTSGWDMLAGAAVGMGVFPLIEAHEGSVPAADCWPVALLLEDAAKELAGVRGAHGD
jgi:hypothetical protein